MLYNGNMNNSNSSLQQLRNSINDLVAELENELGRAPTTPEIIVSLQDSGWKSCNERIFNKVIYQSNALNKIRS